MGFGRPEEEGLITDVIRSHWEDLRNRMDFCQAVPTEKCALFRKLRIRFPTLLLVEEETGIPVNFFTGRRIGYGDRCGCGSGLPDSACCGRTPGMDELQSGVF